MCSKDYMGNTYTQKIIHCLYEIQIELSILYFIWLPDLKPCLLESPFPPLRPDSPSLLGSIGPGSFRPDVCIHGCASLGAHILTTPPFGLPR